MAGAHWQHRVRRWNGAVDRTWPVDPRWPVGSSLGSCLLTVAFPGGNGRPKPAEGTLPGAGRNLLVRVLSCATPGGTDEGVPCINARARADARGKSETKKPGADRQAPAPRARRAAPFHGRRPHVAALALHRRCACDIAPHPPGNNTPEEPARCCFLRAPCVRCVHARRGVRSGEARRLCVLRACVSLPIRVRPGAGEANEAQGPTTHITTTRVRACVPDLPARSRLDLCDVPRLARARPPRVTELTAHQRTWTGRDGGRGKAPSDYA